MKNRTNTFLILLIIVFLVFAYFWYQRSSVDSGEGTTPADSELLGEDFLAVVNRLRAISIDSMFFSNDQFRMLRDLTPVIVIPENIGRQNPFLPF